MNVIKAVLDTINQNGAIGSVTQFDHATLELQILSGGQVGEAWDNPRFELIAMKRDMNSVREVDQDKFTILSKEDHKVQIELKEQFLTYRGSVKMQLVIKDGGRLSTTLFYLSIGRSLDHEIVESLTDIQVLDDLDQVVESLGVLEITASANESKRQENEKLREVAEANRQDEFDHSQLQRDTEFNNKMEEFQEQVSGLEGIQGKPGETPQIRVNETHIQLKYPSQQEWTDLVALESLKGPEGPKGPPGIQGKTGEPGKDGANGEDGQDGMTPNFTIGTVTTLEPGQGATVTIQGTKENPILDIAIPRGPNGKDGEGGVSATDKVDYMGEQHDTLKETNDSNVEYLLREINTAHYEGSNITATDTYQKQVKSAILKGKTGYRDKDTGEILDAFEEGRNLELVSVRVPVLTTSNGFEIFKTGMTLDEFNYNLVNLNNECISIPHSHAAYIETKKEYTLLPNQSYVVRVVEVSNFNNSNYHIRLKIGNRQLRAVNEPLLIEELSKNSYYDIVYTNTTGEPITGVIRVDSYFGGYKIDKIYIGEESHKTNILSTPEDVELGSVGNVKDELNLVTGELTQRTDIRAYQEGDESNSEVLTDMTNTRYKLAKEVVKTVDLNGQKVYSYDGTTHYSCSAAEGALIPTLAIDVPTNLSALVSRQRVTIESQKEQIITLEEENEQLIAQNEVQDIDISLNQDAINFMLFAPATMSVNNKSRNNEGVNTMAAYLANQILKGKLDYALVVGRYGSYKEDIDTILIAEGKQDLIK